MPRLAYTVRVTFPSISTRDRFLAWLVPDHIEGVRFDRRLGDVASNPA